MRYLPTTRPPQFVPFDGVGETEGPHTIQQRELDADTVIYVGDGVILAAIDD